MNSFSGKNVTITGGLGFLGSNLATALSLKNAKVTIVDNLDPLYGANPFNLHTANRKNVKLIVGDIRDKKVMKETLRAADYVFHFAAQVSYIDSLKMPFVDLGINVAGTLSILELLRKHNRAARAYFSSSRMVIGRPVRKIIDEEHPTGPLSLYGIHKLASEGYFRTYGREFGLETTILRLTNPYGPRQQVKHSKYGLVGWFIRQAMADETIRVFGSGDQTRDYIYVDDIVRAILLLMKSPRPSGEIFNLGSGRSTAFKSMVRKVVRTVGRGRVEFVPWPDDYEKIETGSVRISVRKLAARTGWEPRVTLDEGIRRTFQYYRKHLAKYAGQ
jgi:UDP-glucose 4-epimerase